MKKTLIALMALAGVAAAETVNTIDAAWGTAPARGGEFYSASYTLTFTLDALYTLEKSGDVLGFYRGSAINNSHGYNAIVLGGTDDALTLTVGRGRAYDTVGDATGIDADTTFTFQDSVTFTTAIQKGVTYTLSVTGDNQAMTPTLRWEGGSETLAAYNGNMNGDAAITSALNLGTVPEPTTATLSLLALAGLAARRRRK